MHLFSKKALLHSILYLFLYSFSGLTLSADIMSLSDRKDRWEVTLQSQYMESKDIDFDGGAQATLTESWNFGFGLGYNFDEHWALNFDLNWNDRNYTGKRIIEDTGIIENVAGTLYTNSMVFTGIYNFSAKRFTPFVGASAGWMFIDTNIPTAPPQPGFCFDPWYGYVPCSFQPTLTSTELVYGVSAGLRFDVKDNLFLRLSAAQTWIDYSKATSTPSFTTFRFDIGLMF